MEKMRKPARTLVVAAGAVLLFVGVLVLASTQPWKPAKKLLSPIDPAQVTLVSIRNGNKVTRMDITDPAEIRDIVELLNGFTYQSTRYVPPAGGWSYILDVEGPSGPVASVEFGISTIRQGNGDGSSTICSGPPGYFRKLVDLAESATDPL